MVAATASATSMVSKLCSFRSDYRRLKPAKRAMCSTKLAIQIPLRYSSETQPTPKGSSFIRAQDPQRGGQDEEDSSFTTNTRAFTSKVPLSFSLSLEFSRKIHCPDGFVSYIFYFLLFLIWIRKRKTVGLMILMRDWLSLEAFDLFVYRKIWIICWNWQLGLS